MNNGQQLTDLSKEAAIAGSIAAGSFELIPQASLIPVEAFVDSRWSLIYGAACSMRSKISDQIICAESVSDFIAFHSLDRELQRAVDSTGTIEWRRWPEFADTSQAFAPELLGIKYNLAELGRLHLERQDCDVCSKRAEGLISRAEAIKALQDIENLAHGSNGARSPEIEDTFELCEQEDDTPPEIVQGVFHQGSKVALGGGSKSFKTWQLLQLAVCVSSGRQWLDKFNTTKGKVLYLNFELPRWSIRKRITEIRNALGIIPEQGILKIWNLRGHAAGVEKLIPKIIEMIRNHDYILIVLDPIYKLMGDRDEIAAKDISYVMNFVEKLAVETNAAVAFGAHFSKGNQATKDAIDRISGSGVFARDPDTLIMCTEHTIENCFGVTMILRNLPPQDDFTIRFEYPIMNIAHGLDPEDLKAPRKSAPNEKMSEDQMLATLPAAGLSDHDWRSLCTKVFNVSTKTYDRKRDKLKASARIWFSEMESKWNIKIK